jgi:hypothetical protein
MPVLRTSLAHRARVALTLSAGLTATLAAPSAWAQDSALPPAATPAPSPERSTPPPPAWTPAPGDEDPASPPATRPPYAPPGTAPLEPAFALTAPEAMPPVQWQTVPSATRSYTIAGGAIIFGFTYALTAFVGLTMNAENEGSGKNLFVPVAGPFMQMLKTEEEAAKEALALSAALQAIGAAALVVGLAKPKTESVPVNSARVRLTPLVLGQQGGGLGLVGRF